MTVGAKKDRGLGPDPLFSSALAAHQQGSALCLKSQDVFTEAYNVSTVNTIFVSA